MTDRPPPPASPAPRRRGWRVALLGLIGALALALPLSQVLRFQVEALVEHQAERTQLDPLAAAMAVHRGLGGHATVAARVLAGRTALEPERRERQAVVDHELAELQRVLEAGGWPPAQREAQSLQQGWRQLATDIAQRRIDGPRSQRGHRLLQEQVVQVLDHVLAGQAGSTRQALAALPHAHWPAFVAARQQALDTLIARAQASRRAAASALVLLAAGGLWALAAALRPGRAPAPQPGDPGLPGVRRGHGRRAADQPATPSPAQITDAGLQALRRSAENTPSSG